MKPWEKYAAPADDGPWAKYATPEKSGGVAQQIGNLAAGAVRGAGSIGATLLAPIDMAADALAGKGLSLESNRQRRADMDAALQTMGADTDSLAYGAGKLGTEIAGTLGVGGGLARGAAMLPGAARAAPVVDAIRTAGMTAGGATGLAGVAARTAGGAITGGAAAALVNPEDAGAGALIGGALPGAMAAAGKVGGAVGGVLRGPAQTAEQAAAIKAAQQAGYVIPPTQAKPTLVNRLLEGAAGKITTAQNASARNQAVTNNLAATALGLPKGTAITPELLQSVRETAGRAYADIGSTGVIAPGPAYSAALDKIAQPFQLTAGAFPNAAPSPVLSLVESLRSPAFASASAVEKIKQLRTAADDAFRSGNTDLGRASKAAAKALEDVAEEHLKTIGQPQLLSRFRDARQLIAKTYTVEKALNAASGTVDARKLARELQKGKPLSGELKEAAQFAANFPKAAQTTEGMGSLPQTSPLDWIAGAGLSAMTQNPLAFGAVLARPAARSAALSPLVQARLLQQQGGGFGGRIPPELIGSAYRAAPVIGSSDP